MAYSRLTAALEVIEDAVYNERPYYAGICSVNKASADNVIIDGILNTENFNIGGIKNYQYSRDTVYDIFSISGRSISIDAPLNVGDGTYLQNIGIGASCTLFDIRTSTSVTNILINTTDEPALFAGGNVTINGDFQHGFIGGLAAGNTTELQYNINEKFGATSDLTFSENTLNINLKTKMGNVIIEQGTVSNVNKLENETHFDITKDTSSSTISTGIVFNSLSQTSLLQDVSVLSITGPDVAIGYHVDVSTALYVENPDSINSYAIHVAGNALVTGNLFVGTTDGFSPAGATTQIQYNKQMDFYADENLTYLDGLNVDGNVITTSVKNLTSDIISTSDTYFYENTSVESFLTFSAGQLMNINSAENIIYTNLFVCSNSSNIVVSQDCLTWTDSYTVPIQLDNIAFCEQLETYVLGNKNPSSYVYYTTDLTGPFEAAPCHLSTLYKVAWSPKLHLLTSVGGTYSYDLINWSTVGSNLQSIVSGTWKDIQWISNKFVACTTNKIAHSFDGIVWTAYSNVNQFNTLVWNNDKILCLGQDVIATSTDSIEWTTETFNSRNVRSAIWFKEVFVVSSDIDLVYSSDTLTWNDLSVPQNNGLLANNSSFMVSIIGGGPDISYRTYFSENKIRVGKLESKNIHLEKLTLNFSKVDIFSDDATFGTLACPAKIPIRHYSYKHTVGSELLYVPSTWISLFSNFATLNPGSYSVNLFIPSIKGAGNGKSIRLRIKGSSKVYYETDSVVCQNTNYLKAPECENIIYLAVKDTIRFEVFSDVVAVDVPCLESGMVVWMYYIQL